MSGLASISPKFGNFHDYSNELAIEFSMGVVMFWGGKGMMADMQFNWERAKTLIPSAFLSSVRLSQVQENISLCMLANCLV